MKRPSLNKRKKSKPFLFLQFQNGSHQWTNMLLLLYNSYFFYVTVKHCGLISFNSLLKSLFIAKFLTVTFFYDLLLFILVVKLTFYGKTLTESPFISVFYYVGHFYFNSPLLRCSFLFFSWSHWSYSCCRLFVLRVFL